MKNLIVSNIERVDSVKRLITISNSRSQSLTLNLAESAGTYGEGEFSLPPSGRDWKALISYDSGKPILIKFIPSSLFADPDQIDKKMQSGGTDKDHFDSIVGDSTTYQSFKSDRDQNYRGNKYYDLIAGDWGHRGLEGNMVGVLRGGVNIFKVDELCQMVQMLEDHLTRIVSENFEIFTSWGVLRMENNAGHTLLTLKGNSGLNDKFDTRKESYEFELEIGACKAIKDKAFFLTMKYVPKTGDPVFFGIDREGNMVTKAPKDVWEYVEEERSMIARNIGMLAQKDIRVDAGGQVELRAGSHATADPDTGEISLDMAGMILDMDSSTVHVGDKLMRGNPQYQLVTKAFLDQKWGPLIDDLTLLVATPMAALGGIPLAGIVQQLSLMQSIPAKRLATEHTNNTTAT